MEKNQYQKKKEADGYVVVEAAVFLPLASIFIVLLLVHTAAVFAALLNIF